MQPRPSSSASVEQARSTHNEVAVIIGGSRTIWAVDEQLKLVRRRYRDLITDAGQQAVTTVEELQARVDNAVEAGQTSLLLLVRRDGNPRFLALTLDDAADSE